MRKKTAILLTSATMALGLAAFAPSVLADKVAIEPKFTYGETLTPEQFEKTRDELGVDNDAEEIQVRVNELNDLLNDDYPYQQVYSSAYITPADNNGAISVEILTPDTITAITERQYENAALTAGAVDVDIKVASAVPVDGSGALAGVYKAFDASGEGLNDQAVSVAQDELNLTSQITQENKDKEGYSDDLLNAAIAEIKTTIEDKKEENGGSISSDDIQVIVNNVVNNYNLENVISAENITAIENQMNKFSELELSDEQRDQIRNFGEQLQKTGGDLLNKAKTAWENTGPEQKKEMKNEATSIWQQIKDFFNDLFNMTF